jgi:prepilin-type N-terminal cleavage/methylation domain-containing protein
MADGRRIGIFDEMMRRGFTLIEIMVVIAIVAIVMTAGIPSVYRALQRDDLARAMNDTIEGCKTARDRAILQGIPYEFVVDPENSEFNVVAAPQKARRGESSVTGGGGESKSVSSGAPYAAFPRKFAHEVIIELADVNFVNLMQNAGEHGVARVKFFPNGTSDEFTIVYNFKGKQRTVMLDTVTGIASEYIK